MPREQVNYPDLSHKQRQLDIREGFRQNGITEHDTPFVGGSEPWNEAALQVAWTGQEAGLDGSPNGWVQIALEVDLNYIDIVRSYPNGSRPDSTMLWTPTLTPPEIDKLISVLKKAKRKAFGKLPF